MTFDGHITDQQKKLQEQNIKRSRKFKEQKEAETQDKLKGLCQKHPWRGRRK